MNVMEIYRSIQGEGMLMGVPTTFVRFFACNLRCSCSGLCRLSKKALFNGQDALSLAGAQLYPYGYYTFQSRPEYTNTIFVRTEEDARSRQADTIKTWLDWFRYVIEQPDDPQLFTALERLAYTSDERFWQAEKIIEPNQLLMELVVDNRLIVLPCVRDATRKLIALF